MAKSWDLNNCTRISQNDSLCRIFRLLPLRNDYPTDRSSRFGIPPNRPRMVVGSTDTDRRRFRLATHGGQ